MFKAEIYRLEEPNGFFKLMSKTIRLKKGLNRPRRQPRR